MNASLVFTQSQRGTHSVYDDNEEAVFIVFLSQVPTCTVKQILLAVVIPAVCSPLGDERCQDNTLQTCFLV